MTFELKPFQRVVLRNGRTAIVIPNYKVDITSVPLVFILDSSGGGGWMPGLMNYSVSSPEWDVVEVFDTPGLFCDVLDYNRQGGSLWKEEAPGVRVARADVVRARADLEAAEKRLAHALEA